MKRLLVNLYVTCLTFASCLPVLAGRAAALAALPDTGDGRGNVMGYVFIALGIALLIITVVVLLTGLGRRK